MPSSLEVRLSEEMRAFVDLRTNGKNDYATPSEYVRSLIRKDMEAESKRLYVFGELLKSSNDIKNGRLISSDDIENRSRSFLDELELEDKL